MALRILISELLRRYKLKGYEYVKTRWVYKQLYPLYNRKEITDVFKELEKEGVVKREKRGVYRIL